jgi:hypothetical protein
LTKNAVIWSGSWARKQSVSSGFLIQAEQSAAIEMWQKGQSPKQKGFPLPAEASQNFGFPFSEGDSE